VLKSRADCAKQKQIQGEGGGTDVTVPQDEPAKQAGIGATSGMVEGAVAVDEEEKHIPISQVGAGRHAFGAVFTVLVCEREVPGRVLGHEVEHPAGQLVVMDARVPLRGDRVHGPGCGALDEQLALFASLPLEPDVDCAGRNRRGQRPKVV
jgi:hypothetical protein